MFMPWLKGGLILCDVRSLKLLYIEAFSRFNNLEKDRSLKSAINVTINYDIINSSQINIDGPSVN